VAGFGFLAAYLLQARIIDCINHIMVFLRKINCSSSSSSLRHWCRNIWGSSVPNCKSLLSWDPECFGSEVLVYLVYMLLLYGNYKASFGQKGSPQ